MTEKQLRDAYDVCHEMKFFLGNVLASGDQIKSDKELYSKSKRFCSAYEKHIKIQIK